MALMAYSFLFFSLATPVFSPPVSQCLSIQDARRSPPSLKVPKSTDLPPSHTRKRFDRAKNTTYVNIDIPLSPQTSSQSVMGGQRVTAGESSISFHLEYKGSSASDLSAAYLIINFVSEQSQVGKFTAGSNIEVNADGYQYSYQSVSHQTEQITSSSNATSSSPLQKESIVVKLPIADLQQIAFANRLDIKLGKEELRVKSIQLIDLRKTILSHNAN